MSLFGFYEIEIPESLRRLSLQKENSEGYIGILFMALTFTLTSFTCTVQFMGLILVAASQGEWFWPIIGMLISFATFSANLLGTFSKIIAKHSCKLCSYGFLRFTTIYFSLLYLQKI